jgi:hypothetical protein
VRKTIETERGQSQEVEQHRVGGEHDLALAGTERGEGQERGFQAEAAEQDVAVDREQADKGGTPAERGPAPGAGEIPEPPAG